MLLAVAVLPLAAGRWFGHNRNKAITAAVLGVPWINLLILGGGAILANVIGTMGAAMLLIHLLLRINTERTRVKHRWSFSSSWSGTSGGS